MSQAMRLALKGRMTVSPNPMVGCVIVNNGKVIGKGYHHHPGGPHAEIAALGNVQGTLCGATMYVTLEPCFHFGRTPPCVDAILKSGIKSVVIGVKDPNPKTNGKSIAKLRKAGVKVRVGYWQKDLTGMNESFNKFIRQGTPFIVTKTAQTIDGKIATATSESKWITSSAARLYARGMRDEFDAILTGINTVLKDDPGLNAPAKAIKKIIVDSTLKIPLEARIFKKGKPEDCILATTRKASQVKADLLAKKGVIVIFCPSEGGKVDLVWLMRELARRGIAKILVEGGARMIGALLKKKLVDKMLIYMAPKLIGDAKAVSSIDGLNIRAIAKTLKLKQVSCRPIGGDFLFEGYLS